MLIYNQKTNFKPVATRQLPSFVCPNCHKTGGLEMTFYQLHVDTGFIDNLTKKVSSTVFCNQCNQDIPSVKWTPQLEEYFAQEKKQVPIEKPRMKFSWVYKALLAFIGLLFLAGFIALGMAYFNMQKRNQIKTNPQVGDQFYVSYSFIESLEYNPNQAFTWARIDHIEGDTLFVHFHNNKNMYNKTKVDFSIENYDPKFLKVSGSKLMESNELVNFDEQEDNPHDDMIFVYKYKRK